MKNGQLIICEGGDGSGKTTLINNLASGLTASGHTVLVTREPGGTVFAEEVRETLIKKRPSASDYASLRAQLAAFYAARFDHIDKVIKPTLGEGKIVLCDRFELSTYAYQVHNQGVKLQRLFSALHREVCAQLKGFKSTYLVCDLDPAESLKRISGRQDRATHFDEMDIAAHRQVREGMRAGSEYITDCFKFHTIDASRSPEEMVKVAMELLAL